jgi:AAA domain/Toprim-like
VRRLIADGELTGYRVGRSRRIIRVDLNEIDEQPQSGNKADRSLFRSDRSGDITTRVLVVEGEKDVLAAEAAGAVAVCSAMGAGKAHRADWNPLRDRHDTVIADNDKAGEGHAADVARELRAVGAASVTVVKAAVGNDLADHIAAGKTLDELVSVEQGDDTPARRARITWANDIEPEPVVYAWEAEGDEGRIPAGSLSVAAGREGTGKSSFGIWGAAHLSRGTLPGSFYGTPRPVFYVAVEDSWKHTLVPRLIAAGADLSKVGRFEAVSVNDDELTLSLPHDNALLENEIREHGGRTSLPLEVRRQRAKREFREFLDVREARAKKRRRRARLTVTIERPERMAAAVARPASIPRSGDGSPFGPHCLRPAVVRRPGVLRCRSAQHRVAAPFASRGHQNHPIHPTRKPLRRNGTPRGHP